MSEAIQTDEQDKADMKRLAAGFDGALNDLMERHAQRLFHYLLRHLDEADANDLAQETFVRIYQNRTRYNPTHKFSTWLYTIATNLLRDHLRWHKRHPETSLEAHEEEHHSLGEVLKDTSVSPSESLVAEERAEQVRQALQALPEGLRTPLILFEYEDLSHTDIAGILKSTVKTVEMRIYRARQELRKTLSGLVDLRS